MLRFVVGGILKERFVWNVDFVEGGVVNFKEQGFKDFKWDIVFFCLAYQEACVPLVEI